MSSLPDALPPAALAFNPHNTIGALQVGVIISSFLFGVVSIQTYIYFDRFPRDARFMKTLVSFVWLLECGHAVCVSHALYIMTITDYGHPEKLIKTPASLNASVLLSGFIGPIVQAVFTARMYKLSHSIYLPVFCWALSLLRFIGSIITAEKALTMTSLPQFVSDWGWLIKTILVIGAVVDVAIAVTMSYYLRERKEKAFLRTQKMLDKLMKWTIQTGLVTSITAIAVLLAFLLMPRNFVWIALYTLLARSFSNSLLASLNARDKLRMSPDGLASSAHTDGATPGSNRTNGSLALAKYSPGAGIQIAIETSKTMDITGGEEEYYTLQPMTKTSSGYEKSNGSIHQQSGSVAE